MEELKEVKKILKGDSKAIQILDKVYEENQKDFRLYVYRMMLAIICIVSIVLSIIFSIVTDAADNVVFSLPVVLLFILVIENIFVLYGFNTKKIISDDQLKFLNAILKERTTSSVGVYPIIQKDNQCFIEKNGVIKYIGKAKNQTITECEEFIYKQIEDWEGLEHPRYQLRTKILGYLYPR